MGNEHLPVAGGSPVGPVPVTERVALWSVTAQRRYLGARAEDAPEPKSTGVIFRPENAFPHYDSPSAHAVGFSSVS